jgi:hypothetical protein
MTRARLPLLALLAACAGKGGIDQEFTALQPDVAVAPEVLDFGDVVVLYSDTQSVSVLNAGRAELSVNEVTITGPDASAFTVNQAATLVEVEAALAVQVTFSPLTYVDYNATLQIATDDEDSPLVEVPLMGAGADGPSPDIEVDTTVLDFGTVSETSTLWFTLKNEGDGDLILGPVTQTGSGQFESPNLPTEGSTLAPGGETTVIYTYTPTEEGDNATLSIASNDPDEPAVEVLLLGNGGGEFEFPTAVIDCPTRVDPPLSQTLDGRASYDPNGLPIVDYAWSIKDTPRGSTGTILDPAQGLTQMYVDLAGDWEVQLVVTNEAGVKSEPATCAFTAIPDSAFHIELVWDQGNSDLDLHLVQGGYKVFETPGDCCWCNTSPDWGLEGTSDDPRFAIDNLVGYGPEEIKINEPYNGDYYVRVHYFDDKGGGPTTATVRVWIDGAVVGEYPMLLTSGDLWQVGYIDWPEGTFTEEIEDVDGASRKTCY